MLLALAAALLAAGPAPPVVSAPAAAQEATTDFIRRLAGLPPAPPDDIELLSVGHHPLDTMISVVAVRAGTGWRVTYACAGSPACAATADHAARTYDLPPAAAADLEGLLKRLRAAPAPSPAAGRPVCGWTAGVIRVDGPARTLPATCGANPDVAQLEALLSPPGP